MVCATKGSINQMQVFPPDMDYILNAELPNCSSADRRLTAWARQRWSSDSEKAHLNHLLALRSDRRVFPRVSGDTGFVSQTTPSENPHQKHTECHAAAGNTSYCSHSAHGARTVFCKTATYLTPFLLSSKGGHVSQQDPWGSCLWEDKDLCTSS